MEWYQRREPNKIDTNESYGSNWHVNFLLQDWSSVTFFDLWSHHCKKSQKMSLPSADCSLMRLIFTQESAALPLKTVSSMELSKWTTLQSVHCTCLTCTSYHYLCNWNFSLFYLPKYTMVFCEKLGDGHWWRKRNILHYSLIIGNGMDNFQVRFCSHCYVCFQNFDKGCCHVNKCYIIIQSVNCILAQVD